MTALTKDIAREGKNSKLPAYKVAASAVIFRGAMVMINAAGYLVPCSQIADSVFAGISRTSVDATGATSGDYSAEVESEDAFEVNVAAATIANIGDKAWALDDNTIELTQTTNSVLVGRIVEFISSTKVLVKPDSLSTK